MRHSSAIRKPFVDRCDLLTFSVLAAALLFETWGLMDDLSMARARAAIRVQMSGRTPGGSIPPALPDPLAIPPETKPFATEPHPVPVLWDDQGLGSTAQADQRPDYLRCGRADHRSVAMLPYPKRYGRNRWTSPLQSSGQSSVENSKRLYGTDTGAHDELLTNHTARP
jgi:hypothetical protein